MTTASNNYRFHHYEIQIWRQPYKDSTDVHLHRGSSNNAITDQRDSEDRADSEEHTSHRRAQPKHEHTTTEGPTDQQNERTMAVAQSMHNDQVLTVKLCRHLKQ